LKRKHETNLQVIWINAKLIGIIIPVVFLLLLVFSSLARSEIISLSKDKLALMSDSAAKDFSSWAGNILNELEVYQDALEVLGLDSQAAKDLLDSSDGVHGAYPYGLYCGDDKGNYYDSSGWEPGPDFVVTEREWYKEGLTHRRFAFGEPYMDAMTNGVCVSATVRINGEDTISVLSADIYLNYASRLVVQTIAKDVENAFFVTAGSRMVVAGSQHDAVGISLRDEGISKLYQSVNSLLDAGGIGQYEAEGQQGTYYVDINKIDNTNWYFVTCIREDAVLGDLRKIEFLMALASIVAAVFLAIITLKVSKEMGKAKAKAKLDPLTGLLNRSAFKESVTDALENRPGQGLLLMMDLDNFKQINDQLGHPTGDKVLREFSDMVSDYFNRNRDIVGRVGGDEFAVFVGGAAQSTEVDDMMSKFLAITQKALGEPYAAQKLSVSVGGSFAGEKSTCDSLYAAADEALYSIKRGGKNGFLIR